MKQILVVDDQAHVIRVVKMALERAGYQVVSALNGEIAFNLITEHNPDVLYTDIQMPRMNGEELCKKISQEIPDRKFPIIIATSRTEREHREWSSQINNLTFLEKPVSARKLITLLDGYFNTDKQ